MKEVKPYEEGSPPCGPTVPEAADAAPSATLAPEPDLTEGSLI